MAELLSVSASIVALLQLSEKIISYIDGIKDAKSDIIRIRTALGDLPAVLKKLREISNEKKPPSMLYDCAYSLPACEESMKWILENLEKSRRNPLLWPLREKDVAKRLGDITHAKTTLILALGVDVMSQLRVESWHNTLGKLQGVDVKSNFYAARDKAHPGTGKWFIEGEYFKNWMSKERSLLWLNGIPGCGKTILASTIIAALIEEHGSKPDIGIAYFFFDFSDRQKQQSSQMLRSLVDQLCRQLHPGDIPADFKGGMAGAKETIPIEVLIKALHTISKKLSFTYIVLDALDESDRSPVLKDLNKLVNAQSGKLNILMTSRKERDMEEALSDLPALKSIDIQNSVVDLDIQLFVRETLRNEPKFQKWSQEVRQEVEIELGKGAQGM